jgi:hypothetical protein
MSCPSEPGYPNFCYQVSPIIQTIQLNYINNLDFSQFYHSLLILIFVINIQNCSYWFIFTLILKLS